MPRTPLRSPPPPPTYQLNLTVAHDDTELTQVLHQPIQYLSDPFSLVSTDLLEPLELRLQGQHGGLETAPKVTTIASCSPSQLEQSLSHIM